MHRLGQVLAPRIRGLVVMVGAADGELLGKPIGSDEVVERRPDEVLGQIAAGAENRHRGGRRPAGGETSCDSCRGVRSNCCHCCSPNAGGSLTSIGCEETGWRLPCRCILALWADLTTPSNTTSFTPPVLSPSGSNRE